MDPAKKVKVTYDTCFLSYARNYSTYVARAERGCAWPIGMLRIGIMSHTIIRGQVPTVYLPTYVHTRAP